MSNFNSTRKTPEPEAPTGDPAFDEITADDTIPAGFAPGVAISGPPSSGVAPASCMPPSSGVNRSGVPRAPYQRDPYARTSSGLRVRVDTPPLGGAPWFAGLDGLAKQSDGSERARRMLREELATRLGLGIGSPERDRLLRVSSGGLNVSPTPLPGAEGNLEWLLVCLLSQDSCEIALERVCDVPPAIQVALGVLGGRAIHGSSASDDQPLLNPSERVYAGRLNAWLGLYGRPDQLDDHAPESASAETLIQLRELAGEQAKRRRITSCLDFIGNVAGLHIDRAVSLRIE
ncbi:MAG: hypothetical protein H6718_29635 [Polyangiaceae bacterium]|nr:hypothetical protein [Polyangiaceae bacterium]